MEVILANPRGFCAGVKRAIAVVEQALSKYGPPVYVLHEIVHNTHVVKGLAQKGAVFVENLEEIPTGAITIFSAHGVAKAVEEKAGALGLKTIDATCPLVSKVHRRVARLNEKQYDVLIIGHKKHPEVEGTCGRTEGRIHIISKPEDINTLEVADTSRVGYVTQTTLSMDDTMELIALFHSKFPGINSPPRTDICYATQNRQTAVRKLAPDVNLFLVVGSKNSSNSNRLREVAEKCGTNSYLIDSYQEIDADWLQGVTRVGVTAGASAPEILVSEVVDRLSACGANTITEMEGMVEFTQFLEPDLPDFERVRITT